MTAQLKPCRPLLHSFARIFFHLGTRHSKTSINPGSGLWSGRIRRRAQIAATSQIVRWERRKRRCSCATSRRTSRPVCCCVRSALSPFGAGSPLATRAVAAADAPAAPSKSRSLRRGLYSYCIEVCCDCNITVGDWMPRATAAHEHCHPTGFRSTQ